MTRFTRRKPELVSQGWYASKEGMRLRKRANLYLDDPLFQRCRAIAIADELSLSTLLRELVHDGLAFRDMRGPRS